MQVQIPLAQWSFIRLYLEHNYCYPNAEYRIVAQDSSYVTLEFKHSWHVDLIMRKLNA